ncbi:hypothetical protein [Virgibacillus kimchii]
MNANKLMNRIRKLNRWQRHQILVGLLHDIFSGAESGNVESVKRLDAVIQEVEEYEQMNEEG